MRLTNSLESDDVADDDELLEDEVLPVEIRAARAAIGDLEQEFGDRRATAGGASAAGTAEAAAGWRTASAAGAIGERVVENTLPARLPGCWSACRFAPAARSGR